MTQTTTRDNAAATALMEEVLRGGRPLATEYPLVFDEGFAGRIVTVEDDASSEAERPVLSTCAILARELVMCDATCQVGLIGSVATAADRRGEGHGTEALRRAEAEHAAAGCAFSLLWADDADWYQERGWIPVGTEFVYVVERGQALLLPDPTGVREATPDDAARIHELYGTNEYRVARTPAETAALLAGPGISTLVREIAGEVVAYACLGRGEDLADVVHEWGGGLEDVLAVVRGHVELRDADRTYVMVPSTSSDFATFFEITRTPGAKGVLGMGKVASLDAAVALLDELTPAEVSVEAAADAACAITLTGPEGTIDLADEEILLAAVAPRGDRRVVEVVENAVGVELPRLPARPFVWGLDSI